MTLGPMTVVAIVTSWLMVGVLTYWWMARHGHQDPLWLFVAMLLGPLFALVAQEMTERHPRLVDYWQPVRGPKGGIRVLAGLDGSTESDEALDASIRLLGPCIGTLLLAAVVDYDTADTAEDGCATERTCLERAGQRLADLGIDDRTIAYQVVAGRPAEALRMLAAERQVDLIVVGRRGHGMSTRLLGSVSAELLRKAEQPLLVGPALPTRRTRNSRPAARTQS